MQSGSFLDRVKIYLTAGKGGDGCLSFRREKFIEFGGPNGGCGGKGGDIILKAEPNLTTLLELAYNPHNEAQNGEKGGTYNKTGRAGENKYVLVPCGTLVKKDGQTIADLTRPGQEFLVAKGGMGGRGNQSFKTRNNTAPHIAENGQPGEEVTLILELKVLADLGLVGFPNAGKSTFLSRISAARPRIADYPFTTLNPNLGITLHKGLSFATADIPGIIEGASEGKGLGTQFLKHIERTRVLLHLVDPDGFDGMSAEKSVKVIENELKTFDKKLFEKPRILVVNKMDLPAAQKAYETLKKKFKKQERGQALLGRAACLSTCSCARPGSSPPPPCGITRFLPADSHHVAAVHRRRRATVAPTTPSGRVRNPAHQATVHSVPSLFLLHP